MNNKRLNTRINLTQKKIAFFVVNFVLSISNTSAKGKGFR